MALLAVLVSSALAVHDTGKFQLDGDASSSTQPGSPPAPKATDDWDKVCHEVIEPAGTGTQCSTEENTSGAAAVSWTAEPNLDSSIFTGGGSKDHKDVSEWLWKDEGGTPDKDNLLHGFAARYSLPVDPVGGGTACPAPEGAKTCELLLFGSDRYDNSGNAQQGFWFFQNTITTGGKVEKGGTGFTGVHKAGDLLVISDFSNGGTTSTITVHKWDPTCKKTTGDEKGDCGDENLRILATSLEASCASGGLEAGDEFCAIVNPITTKSPWVFKDKSESTEFLNGEFFEGGINLSLLGLGSECFGSVASETRASASTSATLQDFVLAGFDECTSGIKTTPVSGLDEDEKPKAIPEGGLNIPTDPSDASLTVQDKAAITVTGVGSFNATVSFHLCGPFEASSETLCGEGGVEMGSKEVKASGTFLSDSATVTSAGRYCWRAEFSGDSSKGVPPSTDSSPTECFIVNPATPQIPTQAGAGPVDLGKPVTDTLTLTGTAHKPGTGGPTGSNGSINPKELGGDATGKIIFTLYALVLNSEEELECGEKAESSVEGENNPQEVEVNGDGEYNASFTPNVAGKYVWVAEYSGDAPNTNKAGPSACSDENEDVEVSKASPDLSTQATTSATVGQSISDVATLAGLVEPTGAGAVSFDLYKGEDCSAANKVATLPATPSSVDADGDYTSQSFDTTTTGAGSYHWIAHFSGDANNEAVSGTCLESGENTSVGKDTPDLSTQATTSATVGQSISDVATLAGLVEPTGAGAVSFDLYKGEDCSAPNKVATLPATPSSVDADGDYTSQSFDTTTTGAGSYHWIAHFSGDANNEAVSGTCLESGENTSVGKDTPDLSTQATTSATVGQSISDVATLAGLVEPTGAGAVSFDLYKGEDCSAPNKVATLPATPSSVDANGDYTSQSFDTSSTGAGSYHWIAHFSGDANNEAVSGTCLESGENTSVGKDTPDLSTQATTSATVGQSISDVATLAGLVEPTGAGAVSFDLYKGEDCSAANKVATLTATPSSVDADGDYTSQSFDTTTTGAGSYHWIAHFSGDANNEAASGTCLESGENTSVGKDTPDLSTQATTSATVGQSISDVATLAGLVEPTGAGAVSFDLYKGEDCSAANKVATLTATPSSVDADGDYTSQSFDTTTTGAGSYHWIAHFSGDANNEAVSGTCLESGENTSVGKDTPDLSTQATTSATVGQSISDVATLAGLVEPTGAGAVSFDLYKGEDCSAANKVATLTATPSSVDADGDYTSQSFDTTTTGAGSYHWIAHFSGDANNEAASGTCLESGENTSVGKDTPDLSTQATTSATVGQSISDVATLAGLVEPTGAGAVSFDLYKGEDCSAANKVATLTATPSSVDADGDYTSQSFDTTTTGAGSYHWIAHFSGDANNEAASGTCLESGENTSVGKDTPDLSTQATTSATVGQSISDVATLAGLVEPTGAGAVSFDLYKGEDCSAANKVATLTATPSSVDADGDYTSQSFDTTTTGAGSYHWIAHFSGDANNEAASGTCLESGENTSVGKDTPDLSTQATTSATVGQSISDVATLAGLVEPTGAGAVSFDLYKGEDCSAANKVATLPATPSSVDADGDYTSQSFDTTTTGAGSYHWIAHFSGDANNEAVSGTCLESGENTSVGKDTPDLSTQATTSATVGQSISDVATLAGLVEPTGAGAVSFDLYKGEDCSAANKVATLTATPSSVDANGDYTSQSFDTTTTGAGSYHWIAHFSGDANNEAASGTCLESGENTSVGKASPTLTTVAGPGTQLGGQVFDTAHLSAGVNPTGSITFRLYNNPNCAGTPAAEVTNGSVNGNGQYTSPTAAPPAAGEYYWVASYSGDANNNPAQTGCADPSERVTITSPPAGGVAAATIPPPECKLRKARARVFIYTRHRKVRLVIRYVAYSRSKVTTSYTLHGNRGDLFLGKATKNFKKKGVFRLPKKMTVGKMKKVRAAKEFAVQFQIPGTPDYCQHFFKRKLTVPRFVEGQKVWFQSGSVFGGDV